MKESVLRENLIGLMRGGHAHATPEKALAGVDPKLRNARPGPGLHSVWEELEHIRIAQEDILRYTLDPSWESPEWPGGYWPAQTESLAEELWSASVSGFFRDLEEAIKLIRDEGRDLTDEIPHGEGRTYLRQILLIADHNAYHFGQIVQTRKALGDWPE
ncbi:MAG: DinB family protein [Blastocatellia bacterium]